MIVLWLTACGNVSNQNSALVEGCYYPQSAYELFTASTFDPLEVRWAEGVDEVCRFTSGQVQINFKGKDSKICESKIACPEISPALFSEHPSETVKVDAQSNSDWIWSNHSFQHHVDQADQAWATQYLANHGGQISLDDGTELSLISPAQLFINGQPAELELMKCLVMRDVSPPHQTLCILSQSGLGYAHVGEWISIRRAGTKGLDARRAYALNGGSKSYLNSNGRTTK